jgi:hypothetical protein
VKENAKSGTWKVTLLEVVLLLAIPLTGVAAPERYVLSRVVADLGADSTRRISDQVLFNEAGDVVYQVDSNTDVREVVGFYFNGAQIAAPAGYDAVAMVPALNESGMVAGQARTTVGTPMQTAFVWTLAGGAKRAEGLDAGSSDFKAINGNGLALGNSESGTFAAVTWVHPAGQGAVVTTIVPPAGTTRVETIAVNDRGESLLIVDRDAVRRLAIWDGSVTNLIGPVLPAGFNLLNANVKLNEVGDVAAVIFNPTAMIYRVWLVRANDRGNPEIFDFPRSATNVFQVQFNRLGQVCFGTDGDRVEFLDPASGLSRSFDGYRGLLNSNGQVVFGNQRRLLQWDSLLPEVAPVVVPIVDGAPKLAPDVVAFNGRGQIVLRLARTVEPNGDTLEVYEGVTTPPPGPTPVVVVVAARRDALRLGLRERFSRRVVNTVIESGASRVDGRVSYELNGKLPRGLRFQRSSGKIVGRARQTGKFVVRVVAKYRVGGEQRFSAPARVKIRIRRN